MTTTPYPTIRWQEAGVERAVRWRSEAGVAAPESVVVADDTLKADAAYRLAVQGTAILWRGDYQNARNLLQALARRVDRGPREGAQQKPATPAAAFLQHREAQGRRAAVLGRLLVPLTADYRVPLRRGQDVAAACLEALGPGGEDSVISLRGLLALVSAHEWRKKGIPVPAVEG
ncbi:MAG: methyltransferase, partial [Azonexus sp.]